MGCPRQSSAGLRPVSPGRFWWVVYDLDLDVLDEELAVVCNHFDTC